MPSASRTAQAIARMAASQSMPLQGRPVIRSNPIGRAASTTGTPSSTVANQPESRPTAGASMTAATAAPANAAQCSQSAHRRAASASGHDSGGYDDQGRNNHEYQQHRRDSLPVLSARMAAKTLLVNAGRYGEKQQDHPHNQSDRRRSCRICSDYAAGASVVRDCRMRRTTVCDAPSRPAASQRSR